MGEERRSLSDFILKKKLSEIGVQNMIENKDALAKTNRLESSPTKNCTSKAKEVEVDADALFDEL